MTAVSRIKLIIKGYLIFFHTMHHGTVIDYEHCYTYCGIPT